MIIPVRCFTCGTILASKYKRYLQLMNSDTLIFKNGILYTDNEVDANEGDSLFTLEERKNHISEFMLSLNDKIANNSEDSIPKPIEVQIMRQLGIKRYCCNRHLIGHVDILDKL